MSSKIAVVLLIGLAACGEDLPDVDPAGARHGWVVSSVTIPNTTSEAYAVGLNIDEKDETADNQLGSVLAGLSGMAGYNYDLATNAMIADGVILHLIEIQATSLARAERVGLRVLHGVDQDGDPTDNFTGSETFGRDPTRGEGLSVGGIADGRVDVGCGTAPVAVTLPGLEAPYVLPLVGARFDAVVTEDGGLEGRLGGAIPVEFVEGSLIPIFHEGLSRTIASDCPDGVCRENSFGAYLLENLDDNGDGTMSLEEFRGNALVQSLAAPDVDLRYGDEAYDGCGNHDSEADGLSIGIGFRAVPAVF